MNTLPPGNEAHITAIKRKTTMAENEHKSVIKKILDWINPGSRQVRTEVNKLDIIKANTFDYNEWLSQMQKTFDVKLKLKLDSNFISHSDNIFEIRTPPGKLLILPPLNYSVDYGFALKLIGKDGIELVGDTRIEIIKRKTSGACVIIDDLLYYNIRYGHPTMYHTVKPLQLESMERLQFIIYTPIDVDIGQSRLDACMTLFTSK